MCGPTWNSLPLPIACDLLGTQKPPYIYEIPTLCTLGVRPAILSSMNRRKTLVKATGLIMRQTGEAGEICPLIGSLAQHTTRTTRFRRPIEEHRFLRNEGRTSP